MHAEYACIVCMYSCVQTMHEYYACTLCVHHLCMHLLIYIVGMAHSHTPARGKLLCPRANPGARKIAANDWQASTATASAEAPSAFPLSAVLASVAAATAANGSPHCLCHSHDPSALPLSAVLVSGAAAAPPRARERHFPGARAAAPPFASRAVTVAQPAWALAQPAGAPAASRAAQPTSAQPHRRPGWSPLHRCRQRLVLLLCRRLAILLRCLLRRQRLAKLALLLLMPHGWQARL